MGDAGGYLRFPGSLDPQAQEFRPRHVVSSPPHHQLPVLPPPLHNHFFYPPLYPDGGLLGYAYYHHHLQPFHHNLNNADNYNHDYLPQTYFNSTAAAPHPTQTVPPSLTPTRAILLSSLPSDGGVSETLIRRELEVFGEVRGVQMERIRDGIATVHFYDIRHAEAALNAIRDHRMQYHQTGGGGVFLTAARGPGCGGVWAQFTIPSINAVTEGHNQGTIVVFNLDPNASTSQLRQIFQPYGAVKEVRETPLKKQQRFVEFYDVRDAARALREMNGKEILGKPVVIEFSRPGGFSKKFFNSANTKVITKAPNYIPLRPPPPPRRRFNLNSKESNLPQPPSSEPRIMARKNPFEEVKVSCLGVGGLSLKGSGKKLSQSHGGLVEQKSSSGNDNGGGGRAWKGGKLLLKGNKKYDNRFLINEEAMVESSSSLSSSSSSNWVDSRTTVMIKNIPNKYSQKLLLNMLDNHCIHCNEQIAKDGGGEEQNQQPFSSYDFVYLPIDFNNKCNVGYGFVNMTSPQGAWRLYKAFHHQHWEVFNSKKICEVTYARVQGLEALKEHFKNSKFPSEVEHYLPVVFSPPRDGKQLTDPQPINGGCFSGGGGANRVRKQNEEEGSNGDSLKNSTSASSSEGNGCCGGEDGNGERDSS